MAYICLDCEASGPVPPLYNLLSIGTRSVRREGDRHVLGGSLYLELKPIFPGFEAGAMAVCGLDRSTLEKEGVEPKAALLRLAEWSRAESPEERPIFVGHNAVFDWSYIAYYYAHFGLENPFGYKGIDSKSLAMGALGIAWDDTSKENLARMLKLPPEDYTKKHRADYDAQYQAELLVALLDRRS